MNQQVQDMKKILLLFYIGLVTSASAIVVQDYGAAEAAPSEKGFDLNWDYVYSYNGSSAVAVDDYWIVTAGHVGQAASFSVGGESYTSLERVPHPTADIALIRVDKALPGYYDLYTGTLPTIVIGDNPWDVIMVGYGTTGTVSSFSWTTENGGVAWGRGVKRWGTQEIEGSSTSAKTFTMKFNANDTAYEAGAGYGDSGSGVFYKEGGIWKLAGINTEVYSGGVQFDRMEGVSMPTVADWVVATIPEPAAIGLTGFGTIGLFLMRARRRRKWAGRSVFPISRDEPVCDRFDVTDCKVDHGAGRVWAESIVSGLKRFSSNPAAVWRKAVQIRCALSEAFLALFTAAADRFAAAKDVRKPFKSAVIRHTDAFLEGISWDRMVTSMQAARMKSNQAVRKSLCRSLDAFLEILPWDQMVSAYRRFRRFIHFYRHY